MTVEDERPAPSNPSPSRMGGPIIRRVSKSNVLGVLQGRMYVPVGDLRRLFQIDSEEVAPIATAEGTFYVGLPIEAATVLGQLWFEGKIAFDCAPDLKAMVVRAVSPTRMAPHARMRSTPRPSAQPARTRPLQSATESAGDVPAPTSRRRLNAGSDEGRVRPSAIYDATRLDAPVGAVVDPNPPLLTEGDAGDDGTRRRRRGGITRTVRTV